MTPVIFINCKEEPFVDDIIGGLKQYETRNRNTLKRFLGSRVLIAETGHGDPLVKCSATIAEIVEVFTRDKWDEFLQFTWVPIGSSYDWQPDTKRKVLYRLTDVAGVAPFRLPDSCKRHGRVWAEYNEDDDNSERMEKLGTIIEVFEDFLDERGIVIPNDEKRQDPDASNIYGTDYGELEDRLEEVLRSLGMM